MEEWLINSESHGSLLGNGSAVCPGFSRAELEPGGRIIGPNDLLIAAQVLTNGLTLVTDNVGEFARVDGLQIQNWLTAMG